MKKFLAFPIATLAAFSNSATAAITDKDQTENGEANKNEIENVLAERQLKDAVTKAIATYPRGDDLFSFTLEQAADGSLFAFHRSHYSHRSHSSHSSHRSHYSSRY